MAIVKVTNKQELPWELLLLADPDKEIVESYLPNSICYTYNEGSQQLGVIVLQKYNDTAIEIMNVAVAENVQGKGIGLLLVTTVLKEIEKLKNTEKIKVTIKTGDLTIPAIELYKKCGFVITELIEDYFIEHYSEPIFENGKRLRNQIIMQKTI